MNFIYLRNLKQDSISYIEAGRINEESTLDSIHKGSFFTQPSLGNEDIVDLHVSDSTQVQAAYHAGTDKNRHEGTPLSFSLEHADGIFGLLLLCFLFFSHIYNGGLVFMKENVSVLFSPRKSRRIQKESTIKEDFFTAFLVLQTLILVSICLYDVFVEYKLPTVGTLSPFFYIISFTLMIGIFMLIKIYFYKFLGYIFDMKSVADAWIQTQIIVVQILGIIYFIPTLLLVYSDLWHPQIIGFMLIIFLIAQIILFYRIIVFFLHEKFNFLFLIAYLCTAEILPYIFLAAGLTYFYQTDLFSMFLWH